MTNFEATLLTLWIVFSCIGFIAMAIALLWAVRSGQFSRQDRARHLALESHVPEEEEGSRA